MPRTGEWPKLTLAEWAPTQTTLHRWTQIVGKTRLALAPMQNHWWQVVLYVTERGLTTSPIPYDRRTFDVDFSDHVLIARTSDGIRTSSVARPVRRRLLRPLHVAPPHARHRHQDHARADGADGYDVVRRRPGARVVRSGCGPSLLADSPSIRSRAQEVSRALPRQVEPFALLVGWVRSRVHAILGTAGAFAPRRIPNCPDWDDEAYSHECISAGWWPE
jgi:hypothetical protein